MKTIGKIYDEEKDGCSYYERSGDLVLKKCEDCGKNYYIIFWDNVTGQWEPTGMCSCRTYNYKEEKNEEI